MILNSRLFSRLFLIVFIFFVIAFPKGGIKISGIPLTWGYLLILGTSVFIFIFFIYSLKSSFFSKEKIILVFILFLYQSLILSNIIFNGYSEVGFLFSLICGYVFIPWFFFFYFNVFGKNFDYNLLFSLLRKSILFVSVFGIFLFFYKLSTGSFFTIPYLTINAGDVGDLSQKHINRDGVFKLISTYNNGNIYGVCLIMLLPLYEFIEKNKFLHLILKVSLVLTLSRTVWIGLLFYQIINLFKTKKINLISLVSSILFLCILIFAFGYVIEYLNWNLHFLFDKNLGGRAQDMKFLNHGVRWFSFEPFEYISEMTFIAIFKEFGFFITIFVISGFLAPLIYYAFFENHNIISNRIFLGLCLYIIVAQSDGATMFIPVLAIYWFLAFLLIKDV